MLSADGASATAGVTTLMNPDPPPRLALALLGGSLALCFALVPHHALAALPGRVETTDVMRLSAHADGRIAAASPGMDVAVGATAGFGFGVPSCGADGFAFRPIIHAKASAHLHIPRAAKRLEILLRPVQAERELVLSIGARTLSPIMLYGGWQRVSVNLLPADRGARWVRMTLTEGVAALAGDEAMGPEVRGLLHAVVTSNQATPPKTTLPYPVTGSDVLWLEAGHEITMPAPLMMGQALETHGVQVVGSGSSLTLHVEVVSAEGAVESVAVLPAALDIPWNVDLSRRGERAPVRLRLRATGRTGGAAGLRMPRLTAPALRPSEGTSGGRSDTIVLVAVRGLRVDDVLHAKGKPLAAMGRLDMGSTAPDARVALTSLLTGRYPASHGVIGRRDVLADDVPTLAEALRVAGVSTMLRGGFVPLPPADPVWRGFEDVSFADGRQVLPHARPVLDSVADALHSAGPSPVFALVVLGDMTSPFLPRADAWKAHWAGGAPPWPPERSRAAVAAIQRGERELDEPTRQYLTALRRGKMDEVLSALDTFRARLAPAGGKAPTLIITGLGGSHPGDAAGLDPALVDAPLWVESPHWKPAGASCVLDLTDLAATVADLAGLPELEGAQGASARRCVQGIWPSTAYASHERGEDLVRRGDLSLVGPRGDRTSRTLFRRVGATWTHVDQPDAGMRIIADLMGRQLDGWLGAGARWRPVEADPAALRGDGDGYTTPCQR